MKPSTYLRTALPLMSFKLPCMILRHAAENASHDCVAIREHNTHKRLLYILSALMGVPMLPLTTHLKATGVDRIEYI